MNSSDAEQSDPVWALVQRMREEGWAAPTAQQCQRALDLLKKAVACAAADEAAELLTVLRGAAEYFEQIHQEQWEHYLRVKAEGFPPEIREEP